MTPERWRAVKEVFQRVMEAPREARAQVVAAACGDDLELRTELERLLRAHDAAEEERFIEAPAPVAADVAPPGAWSDLTSTQPSAPSEGQAEAWLGREIGPYRLLALLGRGGMGTVFRAEREDAAGRRQVALKLVTRWDESAFLRERFEAERRILAGLDHPHIARFIDAGTTPEGQPYLVMDLVEGLPLVEYARRAGLDVRARVQLFRQVCSAVQYLHRNLVVHRDLKPGNVLVTASGQVKLLDFGIAKLLEPGGAQAATITLLRALTPDYASPEQVRGDVVTTASDVYALGAVLYELLCGERPHRFPSLSPEDVVRVVCLATPERPSSVAARLEARTAPGPQAETLPPDARAGRLRRQLEGDLDVIVMTALRKEPERRYRGVERLDDDLRRYLDSLPVLARPDAFGYRFKKFVRRNRAASAAAALLLASILSGVGLTAWQARAAARERARAERRVTQLRALAHAVLFEVDGALRELPGSAPARALIVARSRAWLAGLRREAAADPTLRPELEQASARLAEVERELQGASAAGR